MRLAFETELAKSQLEIQEQTLQTVGADLHDNIGQLLSLTSLTLNSVELQDTAKAQQKIEDAIDLTKQSIKEMRLLGKLFQGEQLINLGLEKAIQYQVNWLEKTGQFKVTYTITGTHSATPNPSTDLIIFRIIQEVLNNSIKHASAGCISIHLHYSEAQLQLVITDNGVGFNTHDRQAAGSGMGLHNIQKRSGMIGGTVSIKSDAGKGTSTEIIIPYT